MDWVLVILPARAVVRDGFKPGRGRVLATTDFYFSTVDFYFRKKSRFKKQVFFRFLENLSKRKNDCN